MPRPGVSDTTFRLQCLAAALLCAIGLGLAMLPSGAPDAAGPRTSALSGGVTAPAPAPARPGAHTVRHRPAAPAPARGVLTAV